jgi:allantoin racemase
MSGGAFRLAVLHVNTNPAGVDELSESVAAALPAEATFEVLCAKRGAESVESYADEAIAAAEVCELVRGNPSFDAYLVGCFSDPGVDAARELTTAPVVGVSEAAYVSACLIARRFAVLTTLRRGVPELEDSLRERGIAHRCVAVVATDVPVADHGPQNPDSTRALIDAGRRSLSLGAEALVLACAGMAGVGRAVAEAVGLPVCDGVGFGALLAYSTWKAGLQTSKAGGYSWPEPVPYAAMEPFSERAVRTTR